MYDSFRYLMTLSNYSPIIDLFLPDVTKTKAVYLGIKTSFPAASAILKLKTVQDFFLQKLGIQSVQSVCKYYFSYFRTFLFPY